MKITQATPGTILPVDEALCLKTFEQGYLSSQGTHLGRFKEGKASIERYLQGSVFRVQIRGTVLPSVITKMGTTNRGKLWHVMLPPEGIWFQLPFQEVSIRYQTQDGAVKELTVPISISGQLKDTDERDTFPRYRDQSLKEAMSALTHYAFEVTKKFSESYVFETFDAVPLQIANALMRLSGTLSRTIPLKGMRVELPALQCGLANLQAEASRGPASAVLSGSEPDQPDPHDDKAAHHIAEITMSKETSSQTPTMIASWSETRKAIEERLGYAFADDSLLKQALNEGRPTFAKSRALALMGDGALGQVLKNDWWKTNTSIGVSGLSWDAP